MSKSNGKPSDENKMTDIEEAFNSKKSNGFYRYYYWKESELITCWEQLREFYYSTFIKQKTCNWLFRGDVAVCDQKRSMEEAFKTSLDRAFVEFEVKPKDRNKIEKAIIRVFRRRAHLLTGDKDSTQTHLETVALLRHHGGPARILDWMYSFFPAVYLAMNKEYDENETHTTYTVWALNKKWVNYVSMELEEQFLKDTRYVKRHFGKKVVEQRKDSRQRHRDLKYLQIYNNSLFQSYVITYLMNKNSRSLIYAATPYHFNERLAAQRATLLFSGTIDKTWGENLRDTINESLENWLLKKKGERIKEPILWEIPFSLSKEERKRFLRRLDEMNINQATLFPDLDGFAQSLRTRIADPQSLGIDIQ